MMTTPTSNPFDIHGKTIAITGGAGVLCAAMARQLVQQGARLAIIDYDAGRAEALCKELDELPSIVPDSQQPVGSAPRTVPLQADVTDEQAVSAACDRAIKALGHIDVLINGAGGNKKDATCSPPTTFFELPTEALRQVLDLNCLGTMLPCQIVGRHMADRGQGTIINIASMNAFRPLTNIAAYSAAKSAIANFTQWLATYMAQRHDPAIRVNAIAPGFFLTEQNRFLLTDEATGELTDRGKTIIDHTPMNRFGQPDDLVGTTLWLISEASRFVTGIVVPVDGGFSAFSGV